jgi:hypothetical protein
MERPCANCGQLFKPHPSVRNQKYCSERSCQRKRKRDWEKSKLSQDSDYRINKSTSRKRWHSSHPEYWKEYRRKNPSKEERNRIKQHSRNQQVRLKRSKIAKSDELKADQKRISGLFLMVPVSEDAIAKSDELIVDIKPFTPVSEPVRPTPSVIAKTY